MASDNHILSLTEFSSQTHIQTDRWLLTEFSSSPGLVWTENIWCIFRAKSQFSNPSGVVRTGPAVQLWPKSFFCLSHLKVVSFKSFNISKLASWHLEIVWTTVNGMPAEHSNLLRKHTEMNRPIISQRKTKNWLLRHILISLFHICIARQIKKNENKRIRINNLRPRSHLADWDVWKRGFISSFHIFIAGLGLPFTLIRHWNEASEGIWKSQLCVEV